MNLLEELNAKIEKQNKFIKDTPENRVYVLEHFDKIPSNAILIFKMFKEKMEDLEERIKKLEER